MNKFWIKFSIFFHLIDTSFQAFCGVSAIPFRLEVLSDGKLVLGCATPECFGSERGSVIRDSQFNPSGDGDDGFRRDGDLQRTRKRFFDAPNQLAQCSRTFGEESCASSESWVGGLEQTERGLSLQCCSYNGMRFASEVGRPIVHFGEVYSGGEVLRDSRMTGFDLISNIKQIETHSPDEKPSYELTIHRMNCLPDPPELTNDVAIDLKEITIIQNKVLENRIEENEPQTNDQVVQIGEAVVPVENGGGVGGCTGECSQGYYYPIQGNVPACFGPETRVRTTRGEIGIDALEIGDFVESPEANTTTFAEILFFVHRLPNALVKYIRAETDSGFAIELTPQHFIHVADACNHSTLRSEIIYAEKLRVGTCVFVKQENGSYRPTKITRISTVERRGAYSPMTKSGSIVVNNLMASCHNLIKSEHLSYSFFKHLNGFNEWMEEHIFKYFSARKRPKIDVNLPSWLGHMLRSLHLYLPSTLFEMHNEL